MITLEELKHHFHYDENTGIFTWKVSTNPLGCKNGSIAGSNCHGYIQINFRGKSYRAHRLAWLYFYGEWPKYEIDHIDHNPSNNRISNLRDVTKNHNLQNQIRPHKNGKYLGVHFDNTKKKYVAQIKLNGKNHHLGYFLDPKKAHDRYLEEKRKIHITNTL